MLQSVSGKNALLFCGFPVVVMHRRSALQWNGRVHLVRVQNVNRFLYILLYTYIYILYRRCTNGNGFGSRLRFARQFDGN